MIDELAMRLKARQFMAGLDLSNIDKDLTVYTRKVNAKLTTEEMSPGESGYTLTRRDGKSSIVVNELERRERQRFSACHEVGHLVLGLASNHQETPFSKLSLPSGLTNSFFSTRISMTPSFSVWYWKVKR